MVLHRYNPFSEEESLTFQRNMIVTMYTADPDLSDYYFYSLDHSIKFRDQAMSLDIQRACEYIQDLIDNNNRHPEPVQEQPKQPVEEIVTAVSKSSNTVH